jgi:hypothetical protein
MNQDDVKQCPICKRYFVIKNRRYATCGSGNCKKENIRLKQRERDQSISNEIQKQRCKTYYRINKGKLLQYHKDEYIKKTNIIKKRVQTYYLKNREKILLKCKENYKAKKMNAFL